MRIPTDAYTRMGDVAARSAATKKAEGPPAKSDAHAPTTPAEGVRVTVSSEAKRLASAHGHDRSAKIAKLREAVEANQLPIDAHAIAKRIVEGG